MDFGVLWNRHGVRQDVSSGINKDNLLPFPYPLKARWIAAVSSVTPSPKLTMFGHVSELVT
jgi:hypothetical protein